MHVCSWGSITKRRRKKEGPCLMKLYTPSPSILTVVTWVPQSRLAFGQTLHVGWPLGLRPSAITILQCAALLVAGGYVQPCGPIKSLFLLSPACCLIVRPYADSSEPSYATTLFYQSIRAIPCQTSEKMVNVKKWIFFNEMWKIIGQIDDFDRYFNNSCNLGVFLAKNQKYPKITVLKKWKVKKKNVFF